MSELRRAAMTKRANDEREIATALRERIKSLVQYDPNASKMINELMGAYIELQRWREDNNEVNDDDE